MAKDWAINFYKSKAWVKCRIGYMLSKHYICERCRETASICHHKVYLTAANIDDPDITLNWSLLEALCATCHAHEHHVVKATTTETVFNSKGELVKR